MQRKILVSFILAAAIVLVAAVIFGYYYSQPPAANNVQESSVKTFTLTANNFNFTPSEIRAQKGDRVKIILDNVDGFHDWVIDEFNAKTSKVQGPAKAEVEFTADKTGTFEFYCSVGQHRQMGMKGNLIVE